MSRLTEQQQELSERAHKGRAIAFSNRLRKLIRPLSNERWEVPSASERGRVYIVDHRAGTCTCPDYQKRAGREAEACKHQWAVYYLGRRVRWKGPVLMIFDLRRSQWESLWTHTALSKLCGLAHGPTLNHAPAQLTGSCPTCGSAFEADPLYEATRNDLDAAFISNELRIEALLRINNHQARQKARWLGKWQQRIEASRAKRSRRKYLYHEDDSWSLVALLSEHRGTTSQ